MAFKRYAGKTKFMYFLGDTAEQVRDGSLVSLTDSATIVPARNDSTDAILGVARANDTVANDTTVLVPVEVPVETAVEWIIDVDSDGGAADSDVGRFVAVDTAGDALDSNATQVDVSDSAHNSVLITKVISATKVVGVLANLAWHQTYDTA